MAVTVAGITASPEQPKALVMTLEEMVSEPVVQLPGVTAYAGAPVSPVSSKAAEVLIANILFKGVSLV
jgi:hypothetical protein